MESSKQREATSVVIHQRRRRNSQKFRMTGGCGEEKAAVAEWQDVEQLKVEEGTGAEV